MTKADDSKGSQALARRGKSVTLPWRGDEHVLQVEAAVEAGLSRGSVELDLYTDGFSAGMTIHDSHDGAIVARGRTVLDARELRRSLRAPLQYLGVAMDSVEIRVHDGAFEIRVAKRAADNSQPSLDSGMFALKIWFGAGVLGVIAYQLLVPYLAAILWGIGLLLGAWQLKQGMASGRAMLAGRLAIALGMLAQEEKIILPPADAPTHELTEG